MPIWMELLVMTLIAYGAGLALGWIIWGRAGHSLGDNF